MEKLVYLLFYGPGAAGADLREALLGKAAPALREAGASRIAVDVSDADVAQGEGVAIRNSEPPIRAMASFWLESADDCGPCEAALRPHAERLAGYLVAESRPLVHEPPRGRRAAGAKMVTCIRKLGSLSHQEFLDVWLGDHRIVAIETQSTFGYVRNVVVRRLTREAPPWDGIVEESFPIEALTDPLVWYGARSEQEYRERLQRMVASCQRFLDFESLESTPMSEYFLG